MTFTSFSPPRERCRAFSGSIRDAGPGSSSALAAGRGSLMAGHGQSDDLVFRGSGWPGCQVAWQHPADGPAPADGGAVWTLADDPDDSPDRAAFATARWPGCARINIGNGGKGLVEQLAAWRSVVSIHRIVRRYTTIRFTAVSSRRDTPSTGSFNGPLRGVQHQLAQPAGGQRAGREDISVIIDRQR